VTSKRIRLSPSERLEVFNLSLLLLVSAPRTLLRLLRETPREGRCAMSRVSKLLLIVTAVLTLLEMIWVLR
jgi:hypothetical protein